MARPSKKTTDQELRIVLSVLRGEHSVAARRNGVAEQRSWLDSCLRGELEIVDTEDCAEIRDCVSPELVVVP